MKFKKGGKEMKSYLVEVIDGESYLDRKVILAENTGQALNKFLTKQTFNIQSDNATINISGIELIQ